jgi:glutaredoxin
MATNTNTTVKNTTTVPKINSKPTKEFWARDKSKTIRWQVLHVPGCTFVEEAVNLLKEHGEPSVQVTTFSEGSAQQAITTGYNYSPAIFMNGKLLGSVGDLENYYRRNYFASIKEAMEE